ncbi:hypothetical protein TcWFU_010357 [Taenia crassiceps]|uniref:Uncharacterized protein n=1 Tax=Taenia crassiceps TaxID=6207 RepID=A0ABR4Q8P1_9CEST
MTHGNVLRIGGSLVLLIFAIIFFIAGTRLILFDVTPSANCSGHATAKVPKFCTDEQWLRRFTIGSGYTMETIALLLGMAFVAVNIRVCLKLNHGRLPRELQATPNTVPAPRDSHFVSREVTTDAHCSELTSSTAYSVLDGPPDYETACRELQLGPNDGSIIYQPPSTNPPSLETPNSSNASPWRHK